ncbi:hypothetical protein H0H93_011034 [Arthromyces matolae]|nr:hypothetical protein H0H93_011034 [Arthromyces matolae]
MDVVDDETRAQLDDLSKYHRRAAWWETFFFDPQGKSLLEDLDRIASTGIWNRWHQIHGYTPPPLGTFPIPPDALNIPWSTSAAAPFSTNENTMHQPDLAKSSDGRLSEPARSYATRASSRISLRSKAKEDQALSQKRKTPHRRQPNYDTTSWPEVRLVTQKPQLMDTFLLRAWVRSVNDDTTFIIFQCGNFERIGFRHRESQTLFISNLIDVPTCPSYGRLQVGLYLAILQDAIDRLTQRQKADELRPKTKKRRRDTGDIGTSTRYKTRSMISKGLEEAANFEVVKRHASSRPLILMALRFDNYNSTAPGPFLRSGAKRKASYGPREYMSLVLTSKLGNGAIGIAYNGRLELLVDNRAREASVVVKLALEEGHVESLRHEYSIYEHLSDRGVVEGIPSVLGLFEDLESGVLALVMSHVGQNLWDLRPDKSQDFVRVPPEIEYVLCVGASQDHAERLSFRDQYVQILKNIHEAGVLHSDIGPSNLMMKGDDDAAIIDFDQARLFPDATETEQEQRLLVAMLHKQPPRPRHRDNAPRIDYQAMLAELAAESSGDSDDESSTDGPEEENSEKQ